MDSYSVTPEVASSLPGSSAGSAVSTLTAPPHSSRAAEVQSASLPTGKEINVRHFRAYQARLPVTTVSLLLGLTLALLSAPRIPLGSALNYTLIGLGYCCLFGGIAIRLWSINHINSRKSVAIVTSGPYSLCRNPLYVGTLLIGVGILLILQSLTLAVLSLAIIFLYIWGVIPAEEKVLSSRHPEEYRSYCQRVPRWIPRWNRDALAHTKFTWTPAVRREVECSAWWLALAMAVQVVCEFRDAAWWMHPLNWP